MRRAVPTLPRTPVFPQSRLARGLTLVELLVALTLGSLVVLAAVAALSLSRSGFNTVDAAAQLRDDGRFASSIMRRIVLQSGYLDLDYSSNVSGNDFKVKDADYANVEPPVKGFNNSKYKESLVIGTSNTRSTPSVNNSDLLIVRAQPSRILKEISSYPIDDQGIISCMGKNAAFEPVNEDDRRKERIVSAFHIAMSTGGEPALMCTIQTKKSGSVTEWKTEPLVKGVETMQVLFGVDGVTPGSAPSASNPSDSVPERYLRADQLVVSGSDADTNANWKRVRSIRIGLVLRGAPGSAQGEIPAQYPLGAKGVMDSADDPGSVFPAQTDGRLRQTVTFTIHLRNRQDLM